MVRGEWMETAIGRGTDGRSPLDTVVALGIVDDVQVNKRLIVTVRRQVPHIWGVDFALE